MFRFIFNNTKTAAGKPTKRVFNEDQIKDELEKQKVIQDRRNKELSEAKARRDLNQAFGVRLSDGRVRVVHSSLPEFRGTGKTGRQYAAGLKEALRRSGDYERRWADVSSYATNKDLVRIAPTGLEYFQRISQSPYEVGRGGLKEHLDIIDLGRSMFDFRNRMRHMKGKKFINTTGISLFKPAEATIEETQPDNILTIAKNMGSARATLTHMLNNITQMAPFQRGNDLCQCGGLRDDHVTSDVYQKEFDDHLATTGRKLKLHPYLPADVDNSGTNATKFSFLNSPLFGMLRTRKNEDGTYSTKLHRTYDFGDRRYMPMVQIGKSSIKFMRYDKAEDVSTANTQDLINTTYHDGVLCPQCNGLKVQRKNQRSNSVACRKCSDGEVTSIPDVDANGNEYLRDYTVGLGGGKFRYVRPEDAPQCRTCFGQGTLKGIPCAECDATGHAYNNVSCTNCDSNNSTVLLTPENKCTMCDGTGSIPTPKLDKKKRVRGLGISRLFEGNARYALRDNLDESVINTGPILWTGRRNPNCKVCDNDQYVDPDTQLPCECRIAHPEDANAIPSGTRLIHQDSISVPEHHFEEAIRRAYGNTADYSPHDRLYLADRIDPDTAKSPLETMGIGSSSKLTDKNEAFDTSKILGVITPGKILPEEVLKRLQIKSKLNWASPNAKYTASSADLADIVDELKNMHTWPDNVPESAIMRASSGGLVSKAKKFFRINTSALPTHMKQPTKDLENLISSLPDGETGRYNTMLDDFYEATALSNHKDPEVRKEHIPRLQELKEKITKAVSSRYPSTPDTAVEGQPNIHPVVSKLVDILDQFKPKEETNA